MPRPESPPDDAYDDETPEHVQVRLRALERLALEQRRVLHAWGRGRPPTQATLFELEHRAAEALDLDPPGFDPATEGP